MRKIYCYVKGFAHTVHAFGPRWLLSRQLYQLAHQCGMLGVAIDTPVYSRPCTLGEVFPDTVLSERVDAALATLTQRYNENPPNQETIESCEGLR